MTIKPCPFCDQPFILEELKSHIGTIHLGLPDLQKIDETFVDSTLKSNTTAPEADDNDIKTEYSSVEDVETESGSIDKN